MKNFKKILFGYILVVITMATLTGAIIYKLHKEERLYKSAKASEIGKTFVLPVRYGSVYDMEHTLIEVRTPKGNRGIVIVPVVVNQLRICLYEVKVLGIDSVAFVRTRSRYHP